MQPMHAVVILLHVGHGDIGTGGIATAWISCHVFFCWSCSWSKLCLPGFWLPWEWSLKAFLFCPTLGDTLWVEGTSLSAWWVECKNWSLSQPPSKMNPSIQCLLLPQQMGFWLRWVPMVLVSISVWNSWWCQQGWKLSDVFDVVVLNWKNDFSLESHGEIEKRVVGLDGFQKWLKKTMLFGSEKKLWDKQWTKIDEQKH